MTEPLLPFPTVAAARAALTAGETSSRELVSMALDRISALDGRLRACLRVREQEALGQARALDAAGGVRPPLGGVPIVVKDNIAVAGGPTTAGSRALLDRPATVSAPVVRRLEQAGAIVVATTNLDELAFGGECLSGVGGHTLNPRDAVSAPGGSSGGSAAAVASGMALAGLGTDTGGSIRNPSAWCGVVGFKPTYAALPTEGVMPLAWSLDVVGLFTRGVGDAALLFEQAGGALGTAGVRDPEGFGRIGFLPALDPHTDADVRDCLAGVVELTDARPVDEDVFDEALTALVTVMLAEGAAAWRDLVDARWADFGATVRGFLDAGREISAVDYLKAQQLRAELCRRVSAVFEQVDCLILPSMGLSPGPRALDAGAGLGESNVVLDRAARFTGIWNLTGCPVVSLPCGLSPTGWPIALQVVAPPHQDALALAVAGRLEERLALSRTALEPAWAREEWARSRAT